MADGDSSGTASTGLMDDCLIISQSFEELLRNLWQVLTHLRNARLCLKPKKFQLAMRSVEYLGYVVKPEGIAADPVRDFPAPEDLKVLGSFVGLASYYQRFIPSFSKVSARLFELTKKDVPFEWSAACQSMFVSLKEAQINASVLAFPQFGNSFLLETDASGGCLGAVLAHRQEDRTTRPIAYTPTVGVTAV